MSVSSKINPDIQEERENISFKIEDFTNWFHGGADKVKEKRFLGEFRFIFDVLTQSQRNTQKSISWMTPNFKTKCRPVTSVMQKLTKKPFESRL